MPYESNTTLGTTNEVLKIEDTNFLSPIGFALTIDNIKFKNVQFMVQEASIPDLAINNAAFNTPKINIGMHADKATYAPLTCNFIIDENLVNYKEIHDWLLAQINEGEEVKKTRDITLHILSSHNNVSKEIQFIDAYPTSLSSLTFNTTAVDIDYLVANVEFSYSYYKLL